MSGFARVGSVDMLKEFRVSLFTFAQKASMALNDADSDIQRTIIWLKQDQHSYWKNQLRRREEQYTKAKLTLRQKKYIEKSPIGVRCSYIDEEKALAAAQRHLEEAQEKLKKIQRWLPQLEKEIYAYKGQIQGLNNSLEVDIPTAAVHLDNMIDALEAYAALPVPEGVPIVADSASTDSTTPAEDMTTMARRAVVPPDADDNKYQLLRDCTPSPTVRNSIPLASENCRWISNSEISSTLLDAIASIDVDRKPISDDEKVVISRSRGQQQKIYLERSGQTDKGDSGWYIGIIDDTGAEGYDAIRVAELLEIRPDFSEILTLPVGFLVVLDGASVEVIVDPQDNIVRLENSDG